MVGMGLLMLADELARLVAVPARALAAARLPRALLWLFAGMTFSGWVATVAGWYVTEIGRQPFIVYGLVRTADVVSKVPSPMIGLTLALYVTLYLALIVAYVSVLKYMAEKPEEVLQIDAAEQAATPPAPSPRRCCREARHELDELRRRAAGHLHGADGRVDAGLRDQRRLRPRRRHADAPRHRRREGRDDRLDRPVLGRQRDLAGARRRHPAGRLPEGARPGAGRAVPAGGADAGRA